jgi:hypothetical protein
MHSFFLNYFFGKEPYSLAHERFFWNIEHSPMEAPLWTPSCKKKKKNKCIPQEHIFSVYIHECSTLSKPYEIKLGCYWEHLREQLGNLGISKKHDEKHVGNTLGTRKWNQKNKTVPTSPPEGKTGPIMNACRAFAMTAWNFYFQNYLPPFLVWAEGRGRN